MNRYDNREAWIDYAKVIGMFLIVWGHFFPPHVSKYIYSINVPLFFFLSGYLFKDAPFKKLLSKNIRSLAIPYLAFAFLNVIIGMLFVGGGTTLHIDINSLNSSFLYSILGILLGCHSIGDITCAGALWFVYDLFVIKLLYHFTSKNKAVQIISILIAFAAALYVNTIDGWPTTVSPLLSVPIAYCFFVLGRIINGHRLPVFRNDWKCFLLTFVLIVVYWVCVRGLGNAYIFAGKLGSSIFRFIPASLTGLLLFFTIVKELRLKNNYFITASSCGTIVTLSVQGWLINIAYFFISDSSPFFVGTSFIASLLIMIVSFGIIVLINKFLPFLLGGRRFS